jgi:excisionase family DNA binding protein
MMFWHTPFQLLDTDEASRLLDVAPSTLAEWRHSGRGPAFIRVGKRVRYEVTDLRAWLERNRQSNEPSEAVPENTSTSRVSTP